MVGTLWAQTNARPVIEPEPPAFRLFDRDFQPLKSPDPFNALLVHRPTGATQQRRNPAISVSTVGSSSSEPAPKGSPSQPFTRAEHEERFTQELSSRVPEKICSEIVAMSRNLDQLDPRWLGRALSGLPV